jgi:hypothetical protein
MDEIATLLITSDEIATTDGVVTTADVTIGSGDAAVTFGISGCIAALTQIQKTNQ